MTDKGDKPDKSKDKPDTHPVTPKPPDKSESRSETPGQGSKDSKSWIGKEAYEQAKAQAGAHPAENKSLDGLPQTEISGAQGKPPKKVERNIDPKTGQVEIRATYENGMCQSIKYNAQGHVVAFTQSERHGDSNHQVQFTLSDGKISAVTVNGQEIKGQQAEAIKKSAERLISHFTLPPQAVHADKAQSIDDFTPTKPGKGDPASGTLVWKDEHGHLHQSRVDDGLIKDNSGTVIGRCQDNGQVQFGNAPPANIAGKEGWAFHGHGAGNRRVDLVSQKDSLGFHGIFGTLDGKQGYAVVGGNMYTADGKFVGHLRGDGKVELELDPKLGAQLTDINSFRTRWAFHGIENGHERTFSTSNQMVNGDLHMPGNHKLDPSASSSDDGKQAAYTVRMNMILNKVGERIGYLQPPSEASGKLAGGTITFTNTKPPTEMPLCDLKGSVFDWKVLGETLSQSRNLQGICLGKQERMADGSAKAGIGGLFNIQESKDISSQQANLSGERLKQQHEFYNQAAGIFGEKAKVEKEVKADQAESAHLAQLLKDAVKKGQVDAPTLNFLQSKIREIKDKNLGDPLISRKEALDNATNNLEALPSSGDKITGRAVIDGKHYTIANGQVIGKDHKQAGKLHGQDGKITWLDTKSGKSSEKNMAELTGAVWHLQFKDNKGVDHALDWVSLGAQNGIVSMADLKNKARNEVEYAKYANGRNPTDETKQAILLTELREKQLHDRLDKIAHGGISNDAVGKKNLDYLIDGPKKIVRADCYKQSDLPKPEKIQLPAITNASAVNGRLRIGNDQYNIKKGKLYLAGDAGKADHRCGTFNGNYTVTVDGKGMLNLASESRVVLEFRQGNEKDPHQIIGFGESRFDGAGERISGGLVDRKELIRQATQAATEVNKSVKAFHDKQSIVTGGMANYSMADPDGRLKHINEQMKDQIAVVNKKLDQVFAGGFDADKFTNNHLDVSISATRALLKSANLSATDAADLSQTAQHGQQMFDEVGSMAVMTIATAGTGALISGAATAGRLATLGRAGIVGLRVVSSAGVGGVTYATMHQTRDGDANQFGKNLGAGAVQGVMMSAGSLAQGFNEASAFSKAQNITRLAQMEELAVQARSAASTSAELANAARLEQMASNPLSRLAFSTADNRALHTALKLGINVADPIVTNTGWGISSALASDDTTDKKLKYFDAVSQKLKNLLDVRQQAPTVLAMMLSHGIGKMSNLASTSMLTKLEYDDQTIGRVSHIITGTTNAAGFGATNAAWKSLNDQGRQIGATYGFKQVSAQLLSEKFKGGQFLSDTVQGGATNAAMFAPVAPFLPHISNWSAKLGQSLSEGASRRAPEPASTPEEITPPVTSPPVLPVTGATQHASDNPAGSQTQASSDTVQHGHTAPTVTQPGAQAGAQAGQADAGATSVSLTTSSQLLHSGDSGAQQQQSDSHAGSHSQQQAQQQLQQQSQQQPQPSPQQQSQQQQSDSHAGSHSQQQPQQQLQQQSQQQPSPQQQSQPQQPSPQQQSQPQQPSPQQRRLKGDDSASETLDFTPQTQPVDSGRSSNHPLSLNAQQAGPLYAKSQSLLSGEKETLATDKGKSTSNEIDNKQITEQSTERSERSKDTQNEDTTIRETETADRIAALERQWVDKENFLPFILARNSFDDRAKLLDLDPAEVRETHEQVNKLIRAAEALISESERSILATQIYRNASNPWGINQGNHPTCAPAATSTRIYARYPASAARVLTDIALKGEFHTADGSTIKLRPEDIHLDAENRQEHANSRDSLHESLTTIGLTHDKVRSYADKLLQLALVNSYWQRQTKAPDGAEYEPGSIRYEQHSPSDRLDGGDRLVVRKPGSSEAELLYETTRDTTETPELVTHPKFGPKHVEDAFHQVTGREEHFVIHHSELAYSSRPQRMFTNEHEFIKQLQANNISEKNPIQIMINGGCEPFRKNSSDAAGAEDSAHAITLTGHDRQTHKLRIDNTWGILAQHAANKMDHGEPVDERDLYIATLPTLSMERIDLLRAVSKHKPERLLDLWRTRLLAHHTMEEDLHNPNISFDEKAGILHDWSRYTLSPADCKANLEQFLSSTIMSEKVRERLPLEEWQYYVNDAKSMLASLEQAKTTEPRTSEALIAKSAGKTALEKTIKKTTISSEKQNVEASLNAKDVQPEITREDLLTIGAEHIADDKEYRQFASASKQFEERVERLHLNPREVQETHKLVSDLLSMENAVIAKPERILLASQILRNAGHPWGINQGDHPTCALAATSTRIYSRYPASAARILNEIAQRGEFTTTDGTKIKIRREDLALDPESAREHKLRLLPALSTLDWLGVSILSGRSYADKLLQLASANAYWQRQTIGPDGKQYELGSIRYEQGNPIDRFNKGDKLVAYHPGKSEPEPITGRATNESSVQARIDSPCIKSSHLEGIFHQLTGRNEQFVISQTSRVDSLLKQSTFRRHYDSEQDFKELLIRNNVSEVNPLIMAVNDLSEPFLRDGGGDAGGNQTYHAITLTGFNAKREQVHLDNTWGPGAQRKASPNDLGKPISLHDLYLASLAEGNTDRIDLLRAESKKDPLRSLELWRSQLIANNDLQESLAATADAQEKAMTVEHWEGYAISPSQCKQNLEQFIDWAKTVNWKRTIVPPGELAYYTKAAQAMLRSLDSPSDAAVTVEKKESFPHSVQALDHLLEDSTARNQLLAEQKAWLAENNHGLTESQASLVKEAIETAQQADTDPHEAAWLAQALTLLKSKTQDQKGASDDLILNVAADPKAAHDQLSTSADIAATAGSLAGEKLRVKDPTIEQLITQLESRVPIRQGIEEVHQQILQYFSKKDNLRTSWSDRKKTTHAFHLQVKLNALDKLLKAPQFNEELRGLRNASHDKNSNPEMLDAYLQSLSTKFGQEVQQAKKSSESLKVLAQADNESLDHLSESDTKELVNNAREAVFEQLSKDGLGVEEIKDNLYKIKSIADGITGQVIPKEFAENIVADLEKRGLDHKQIATAIEYLENRKPYLSIKGMESDFSQLERQLDLQNEDFRFSHFKMIQGRGAGQALHALVLGSGSPGTSLFYHFHKSTGIHGDICRLETLKDTDMVWNSPSFNKGDDRFKDGVVITYPAGNKMLVSVRDGRTVAHDLEFDEVTKSWTVGEQPVPLPNFVLFDNKDTTHLQPDSEKLIANVLSSLHSEFNLLDNDDLIGHSIDSGFTGGINFFDLGKAQIDESSRKEFVDKLAAIAKARGGSDAVDTDQTDLVNRLTKVATNAQTDLMEIKCIKQLFADSRPRKDGTNEPIETLIKRFDDVTFRQVADFMKASRQLHEQLEQKLGPKIDDPNNVMYVVFEKEGSAHFIHEAYRQTNGIDNKQFIYEADLRRLASAGLLKGKELVLLDDGFDWGKDCKNKLEIVKQINDLCPDANSEPAKVLIANILALDKPEDRDQSFEMFKNDLVEAAKKKAKEDTNEAEAKAQVFLTKLEAPINVIDCLPSNKTLLAANASEAPTPAARKGLSTTEGLKEVWTHLTPNNTQEPIKDFVDAVGHYSTRENKRFQLYADIICYAQRNFAWVERNNSAWSIAAFQDS